MTTTQEYIPLTPQEFKARMEEICGFELTNAGVTLADLTRLTKKQIKMLEKLGQS